MTSITSLIGRTWYNPGEQGPKEAVVCQYMGIRLKSGLLRENASTFWEFVATPEADATRSLLRMFLRVQHLLMQTIPASAYLEWGGERGTCIHVIYTPDDDECNVTEQADGKLAVLMAADTKAFAKGNPNSRWKTSDLIPCASVWDSLLEMYGCAGATGMSAFNSFSSPVLQLPNSHVPMATTDFDPSVFFSKFVPWFQQRQLIEMPMWGESEQFNASALRRMSRSLPNGKSDDETSVWESILARMPVAQKQLSNRYAEWATMEVEHGLDGPQVNYVAPGEDAIQQHEALPLPHMPYFDKRLSPMAIWIASFLMRVETYGFVYKQHVLLLKLFMGAMDCMREASAGEIHYNAILAGPNSTSKSYLFTLLEKMLIKGTVDRATRRTENSLTYGKDQGCRVLIDHELPADFFGDPSARKDSSARTAQTKEILTSHESRVETCQYIDGKRTRVEDNSRAHLCYLAATNDWSIGQSAKGGPGKDMALVSRFDIIFPTATTVTGKSIWDVMAMERNPSDAEQAGMNELTEWSRTVQKCVYWIMRLQRLKAMPPVDLSQAHVVIRRLCDAKSTQVAQRTVERVIIMARILCIITALHRHFAYTTSPRKGEVPTVRSMLELTPYLVVTAEQAKFAIGLFEADFEDKTEAPVLQALSKCQMRADPDLGFCYLSIQGCNNMQQIVDELLMHMPSKADVTSDSVHAFLGRLRTRKITSAPYVPNLNSKHGVVADEQRPSSAYYAMKNTAFHAAYVEKTVQSDVSLEQTLAKACHVGPAGTELTASTVDNYAHLLKTRTNSRAPAAFTKPCAFIPPVAAHIIGNSAQETLLQDHRRHSFMVVDKPIECVETENRGGVSFDAAKCAQEDNVLITYPDTYVSMAAAKLETRVPPEGSERLDALKSTYPSDMFYSNKRQRLY